MNHASWTRHVSPRFASLARSAALAAGLIAAPAVADAADITIGEGKAISWGQFFVADQIGAWEKEGLTPTVVPFASGRLMLDALVGGGVHIGAAAETPVTFSVLNDLPVRVIATLNHHEPFDLVAVKEIATINDIKGRTIGYSQGTNAHYYLQKLLDAAGLTWADVNAVSLNPADFVNGLVNGSIDAFIWTEPHISQALAQGGDRLHVVSTPGLYHTYSLVTVLQSTIDDQPELLVSALKALIAADEYLKANPDEAARLTAERIDLDPEVARAFWPRANFDLALDKAALVKAMEEEAEWAIASGLVRPDATVPDFNTIVVESLLETARGD